MDRFDYPIHGDGPDPNSGLMKSPVQEGADPAHHDLDQHAHP